MKLTACSGTTKVRAASPASGDRAADIHASCTPAMVKVPTASASMPRGRGLAIGRRLTRDAAGLGSTCMTFAYPLEAGSASEQKLGRPASAHGRVRSTSPLPGSSTKKR